MRPIIQTQADRSPSSDVLAIHVVAALSRAQRRGTPINLEQLAQEVGARKADVRRIVSALDAQGLVDATRMRLTLVGFAMGVASLGAPLKKLRQPKRATKQDKRVVPTPEQSQSGERSLPSNVVTLSARRAA